MGTVVLYRVCSTGLRQTQGSPSFCLFRLQIRSYLSYLLLSRPELSHLLLSTVLLSYLLLSTVLPASLYCLTVLTVLPAPFNCLTVLPAPFDCLTCSFRGRETGLRLSCCHAIHAATAHRSLSGLVMHFQCVQSLDLAHCDCSSRHERNRTSLSTVILTYRRWMWPFAHGAQRSQHHSRWQNNAIGVCVCGPYGMYMYIYIYMCIFVYIYIYICIHIYIYIYIHIVTLFCSGSIGARCAQEHASFYALTSLFPSIS